MLEQFLASNDREFDDITDWMDENDCDEISLGVDDFLREVSNMMLEGSHFE